MSALLVAIEGIDGSGKGTQAERLQQAISSQGLKCGLLSFPRYSATHFGRWIGEFLNGRFGALEQVNPFLVSLLFAGDRFESRQVLFEAIAENDVLVLDRYVASNIAHQAAKISESERSQLAEFVEQVEFEVYALPRPDLVLLLDISADRSQELIAKKQQRTYTDRPADLHEADASYLGKVRQTYLWLAESRPEWRTIQCFESGTLRSIEQIHTELLAQVLERWTLKSRNG